MNLENVSAIFMEITVTVEELCWGPISNNKGGTNNG